MRLVDEVESAALATLLAPFRSGVLAWPDRVAFLRARLGAPLTEVPRASLICEQSFKPDADALQAAAFEVSANLAGQKSRLLTGVSKGPRPLSTGEQGSPVAPFPLVLVLPPRQREEARALLARAPQLAGTEGRVVAAAANVAGARSHESDLERLCGGISSMSKSKCRVFWTDPAASIDRALLREWRELDAPRPILDGRFVSRPGVFAWDRIDPASELLIAELPGSLSGTAADLGAGFGYLSDALLRKCPGIVALDVYEAEARGLDLARANLSGHAERVAIEYRWHDVTAGLPKTYDNIVTNPPFHTSNGADDPGLGRRFIAAAARALKPGGRLFLVANRHLPYEAVLNASFGSVRIAAQRYGFKIIEAARALAGSSR